MKLQRRRQTVRLRGSHAHHGEVDAQGREGGPLPRERVWQHAALRRRRLGGPCRSLRGEELAVLWLLVRV